MTRGTMRRRRIIRRNLSNDAMWLFQYHIECKMVTIFPRTIVSQADINQRLFRRFFPFFSPELHGNCQFEAHATGESGARMVCRPGMRKA